ncbi:unnamed protein product [Nippostrongylus brasiliensis]|uniref:Uncharacterized protein n=1 Tax=Nippostrongylus brasiliensis TaxID=27835 RepID=A0A0N4XRA7_NIPBR|nr:unnamed protein product [Nippostrongylus brasiliensis]
MLALEKPPRIARYGMKLKYLSGSMGILLLLLHGIVENVGSANSWHGDKTSYEDVRRGGEGDSIPGSPRRKKRDNQANANRSCLKKEALRVSRGGSRERTRSRNEDGTRGRIGDRKRVKRNSKI